MLAPKEGLIHMSARVFAHDIRRTSSISSPDLYFGNVSGHAGGERRGVHQMRGMHRKRPFRSRRESSAFAVGMLRDVGHGAHDMRRTCLISSRDLTFLGFASVILVMAYE